MSHSGGENEHVGGQKPTTDAKIVPKESTPGCGLYPSHANVLGEGSQKHPGQLFKYLENCPPIAL